MSSVSNLELAKLLTDKKSSFLKKLKYAGLNELEYWEKRPENLSRELLERYLAAIDENKIIYPQMEERESDNGKYGQTGFKWVFKFEDDFFIMRRCIRVYIKGFFFEINDPRGAEIQSFKKSTPTLRVV
ncbi:MAG: hypothetical protein HQK50_09420 [Oligoflexia bacterium]|nr:hypothetical protein [Oligoflexia bacterium]